MNAMRLSIRIKHLTAQNQIYHRNRHVNQLQRKKNRKSRKKNSRAQNKHRPESEREMNVRKNKQIYRINKCPTDNIELKRNEKRKEEMFCKWVS